MECLQEIAQAASFRVGRTTDVALINRVISHPSVYPHVADDSAPSAHEFDATTAAGHPNVYFIAVHDEAELLGLFMLHQHNGVMYEVHTCLLPNAWGARALKAGAETRAWIFANTPCEKLITFVPQGNTLALRFAKRCGLRIEGIITKSYRKHGVLLDQYVLGIEKGASCL